MANFTVIDEEFVCENCGYNVKKLGYSCRNHCPKCLYSKHVDINPGDREETCQGLLEPIGLDVNSKKGYIIIFKCQKCGMIRKNKVAEDDDMDLVIKLSHPAIALLSLLVVFVAIAISVFFASLSHLVEKAAAMKDENDLTI